MASLFGSISLAVRSLLANQGALQTASNNIANVNTTGYARQRAVFDESAPIFYGGLQFGTGVTLDRVESIRDRILELRLHQETQRQGYLDSYLGVIRQAEALFNETGGAGLQGVISAFFNSLQDLSANPASIPLRQGVLSAAQNMTESFQQSALALKQIQLSTNLAIPEAVEQANRLTEQIAALNRDIAGLSATGQEPGSLVDQRDQLIRQLSGLMEVNVIDAGNGSQTLTTTGGAALVVADRSFALDTFPDPSTGFYRIFSNGVDFTTSLTGGQIGGLLEARDQALPAILSSLDTLAADLASAFNSVHRSGFDLNGGVAGDLFTPPPAGGAGAAAAFQLAINDPALLAASADGSPGSGGNLAALLALRDQPVIASQKITAFYGRMVGSLASDVRKTQITLEAQQLIMQQLEDRRAAFSGVSLDEEAANLIRFQRAFQAAARVITVADELTEIAVNLGRR